MDLKAKSSAILFKIKSEECEGLFNGFSIHEVEVRGRLFGNYSFELSWILLVVDFD